jgi:hypothetical protein
VFDGELQCGNRPLLVAGASGEQRLNSRGPVDHVRVFISMFSRKLMNSMLWWLRSSRVSRLCRMDRATRSNAQRLRRQTDAAEYLP